MIKRIAVVPLVVLLVCMNLGAQGPVVDTRQDPPADFVGDGCSSWPDGDYRECCVAHDRAYFRGGTKAERKAADKQLRDCVRAKGHKYISVMMFWGVRIGGVPWLPLPSRWGFGQKEPAKEN